MTRRLRGGGEYYENVGPPPPEAFVQEIRKEKIDKVVALRTRTLTVVLDRLEDSFNIAAVLRTCEGMGLQEVHVIDNPAYPFEPHGRVTQGCDKWLDVQKYKSFGACYSKLHDRGFKVLASALREDAQPIYETDFTQKLAVVFGNERHGVSDEVLAQADGLFWIPMRGFSQSLNISVATAMTLSYAIGQRVARSGAAGDLSTEEAEALRDRFTYLSVKQRKKIYPAGPP